MISKDRMFEEFNINECEGVDERLLQQVWSQLTTLFVSKKKKPIILQADGQNFTVHYGFAALRQNEQKRNRFSVFEIWIGSKHPSEHDEFDAQTIYLAKIQGKITLGQVTEYSITHDTHIGIEEYSTDPIDEPIEMTAFTIKELQSILARLLQVS